MCMMRAVRLLTSTQYLILIEIEHAETELNQQARV